MVKLLFVDPDRCIGCGECELACSLAHEGVFNPLKSHVTVVRLIDVGINFPVICQHCADPICEKVCPRKAIRREPETNAMLIDEELCIGCRTCVYACPIGAIRYDPDKGKAVKCDLCGGKPACAEVCSWEAIRYVEAVEDMVSRRVEAIEHVAKLLRMSTGVARESEQTQASGLWNTLHHSQPSRAIEAFLSFKTKLSLGELLRQVRSEDEFSQKKKE